jgi:hypothetical protein
MTEGATVTKATGGDRHARRNGDRYFLVALRHRPALALSAECPTRVLTLDHKVYQDVGHGEWTGFYDWLRDPCGDIVGVRYWPFEDVQLPLDLGASATLASPALVVSPDGAKAEVYFTTSRQVVPADSADQDFGCSKVFAAADGELAICFDVSALTDTELASLRAAVTTAQATVGVRDG